MCLIWRVIDYVRWSKTSLVFDMASYWLREWIENLSCVRYGELSITWVDWKLVMCLIWQVIDYVRWSKASHANAALLYLCTNGGISGRKKSANAAVDDITRFCATTVSMCNVKRLKYNVYYTSLTRHRFNHTKQKLLISSLCQQSMMTPLHQWVVVSQTQGLPFQQK
jgi:hypothetical protein